MTERRFVEHLPDLIQPEEYAADPAGKRVRVRIRVTAEGVEAIGDAVRPEEPERVIADRGARRVSRARIAARRRRAAATG